MPYSIDFKPEAKNDLASILGYIANELHQPIAAQKLNDEFERRADFLRDNPEMFSAAADDGLAKRGYRTFGVGTYIVFYIVGRKTKTIDIIRIISGKRVYSYLLP